jgi:hypothetical protein
VPLQDVPLEMVDVSWKMATLNVSVTKVTSLEKMGKLVKVFILYV